MNWWSVKIGKGVNGEIWENWVQIEKMQKTNVQLDGKNERDGQVLDSVGKSQR